MADDSLAVVYQALRTALFNQGVWGTDAFADVAPATGVTRPYVIFYYMGGGERNMVKHQDASIVMGVKIVADDQKQAFTGSRQISALLNDQGEQETAGISAPSGSGWQISTITQQQAIHIVERFEKASPVYHAGHQYRFNMETT